MAQDLKLFHAQYKGVFTKDMFFVATTMEEALQDAKIFEMGAKLVSLQECEQEVYLDLARLVKEAEEFAKG